MSTTVELPRATPIAVPHIVDIGSNIGDKVFRGFYNGRKVHPDDWSAVLSRAKSAGVETEIITGASLSECRTTLKLLEEREGTAGLFTTIGCHPTRASDFEKHAGGPSAYLKELGDLIEGNMISQGGRVVAIGELGLDGDRLMACEMDIQLKYFELQLELVKRFELPLFLHSRAAHQDLIDILRSYSGPKPLRGVVHSHSGTLEEALEYIEMGFYVGINGCSLKTPENVECVKSLPLEKLMIESDCPYCEVRPSHASFPFLSSLKSSPLKPLYAPTAVKKEKWVEGAAVKSRNEPACTGQIAWILAELKGVSLEEVCRVTTRNAVTLFGLPLVLDIL